MASTETVILGKEEIAHKLKRIAYQIYEANISQEEVVIADELLLLLAPSYWVVV